MTTKLAAPPGISGTRRRRAGANAPARLSAFLLVSIIAVLIALFSLVPLGYVVFMTAATAGTPPSP